MERRSRLLYNYGVIFFKTLASWRWFYTWVGWLQALASCHTTISQMTLMHSTSVSSSFFLAAARRHSRFRTAAATAAATIPRRCWTHMSALITGYFCVTCARSQPAGTATSNFRTAYVHVSSSKYCKPLHHGVETVCLQQRPTPMASSSAAPKSSQPIFRWYCCQYPMQDILKKIGDRHVNTPMSRILMKTSLCSWSTTVQKTAKVVISLKISSRMLLCQFDKGTSNVKSNRISKRISNRISCVSGISR